MPHCSFAFLLLAAALRGASALSLPTARRQPLAGVARTAAHHALGFSTALLLAASSPHPAALAAELTCEPGETTAACATLRKQSIANSKLTDKAAKKVFDAAVELAAAGADPETQQRDEGALRKAEKRFTMLVDEFAPEYATGYSSRGNVRVALGDLDGASSDYATALTLAPLADDAWVNYLNRGSTLLALGKGEEALADLERSVVMSKGDKLAVLGRGSVLHALGRYGPASFDYGAVLEKSPNDIQVCAIPPLRPH